MARIIQFHPVAGTGRAKPDVCRQGALPALRSMLRAIATRRQLADLDPRGLADLGLSRADALAEAARAPWDVAPRRR